MQTIETELKQKKGNLASKSDTQTRSLESTEAFAPATQSSSSTLSRDLAQSLMGLINSVNKDGVTPETVNASCNAASQIYKILRLNYDMKKEGF
jgi:hypothetical protein